MLTSLNFKRRVEQFLLRVLQWAEVGWGWGCIWGHIKCVRHLCRSIRHEASSMIKSNIKSKTNEVIYTLSYSISIIGIVMYCTSISYHT